MMMIPIVLWLHVCGVWAQYMHSEDVGGNGKYLLEWTTTSTQLKIKITCETQGWVGFGIGERDAGSMDGADIMVATVQDGVVSVKDYYALGKTTPILDSCNDWLPVAGSKNSTHVIVEAKRALVTNDGQDRDIRDDISKVLIAWGTSTSLTYHSSNRQIWKKNFISGGESQDVQARLDNGTLFSHALRNNHTIDSSQRTEYLNKCFNWTLGQKYVIGFKDYLNNATRLLVHHIVVYGHYTDDCSDGQGLTLYAGPTNPEVASEFPPEMHIVMGGSSGFKALKLQTHYDNPNLLTNQFDDSGSDILYQNSPRQYEGGVLTLGDPTTNYQGSVFGSGNYSSFTYDCPSSCTSNWTSNITVYSRLLHMHQVGTMMSTEHIRSGTVLDTTTTQFFTFGTMDYNHFQRFEVMPGDAFRTTCWYDKTLTANNSNEVFGLGSDQEMCIDFILYWPKQSGITGSACGYNVCGSMTANTSVATVERGWGHPKDICHVITDAPTTDSSTIAPTAAVQYSSAPVRDPSLIIFTMPAVLTAMRILVSTWNLL